MTSNTKINLEEYEEYTEREIEYIDRYKELSNNSMEDEELYDIIIKYNFNDERIREAILHHIKLLNKNSDEYNWGLVSKGKKLKTKIEENTRPTDNVNYKNKNKNFNSRRPRNDRNQNNQEQTNLDNSQQNNEFTYNRRGTYRGNRRGRTRGGNRGGRGGRNNFDRNDFVETHLPSEPLVHNIVTDNIVNNEIASNPIENNNEINKNTDENNSQENTNVKETTVPEQIQLIHTNEVNTLETNTILTPSTNNAPTTNKTHEIQTVECFFQKFTLERENEVNKLLEEKKTVTKERDPKLFYEECVNHFTRDNSVSSVSTFTYKPLVKPIQNKNTINSQPQVTYNQTATTTQTAPSTSTNKNFPHKPAFNQHSQNPESSFFGQQPMMNMYPMFYPHAPADSNMTNPQFFPQMMPPQMMYFMNQFYQQQMHNQMQMQDPDYLESLKGQKGGKNYAYPSREAMNFMNPLYFNQPGSQGENANFYKNDSGDQSAGGNYYYYGGK